MKKREVMILARDMTRIYNFKGMLHGRMYKPVYIDFRQIIQGFKDLKRIEHALAYFT